MFPGYEGSIGGITEGVLQNLTAAANRKPAERDEIKDPDKVFADVSKRQFDRYEREFKPFEVDLIRRAETDTSLVDAVPQDVEQQQRIAEDISRRNRERFGIESTAVLSEERQKSFTKEWSG